MRFSIVIPTYNRAQLVFKTIETVLAQGWEDFEVIVVDDGSTDETESLFSQYLHPKVTYFKKVNGERAAARNFGASRAKGDYLNFFDSDDLMLPNHLQEADRCIQALGRPEVFALGYRVEDGNGQVKRTVADLPDPMNSELLLGNVLGCNPVFVRRDVFASVSFLETRALAGTEDWLLWLRLAARYSFRFWNQVTCVLVDHDGRSVYHFAEDKLVARSDALLAGLAADKVFMGRYGEKLSRIRAFRQLYNGLHLALSGQIKRPLILIAKAATIHPPTIFRKTTLGTLKHVALNVFGRGLKKD